MPVAAPPPESGSMKAILTSAAAGAVKSAATSNRPGATNVLARMAPPSPPARSSRGLKRKKVRARALPRLGVAPGDRVGTLAWNGYRHFELYYAISGMGAITHTINPRLFHEQLAYIIGDAEDAIVFFDLTFTALVEKLAAACKGVKHWVAMTDRSHLPQTAIPGLSCYEDLVAAES